MIRLLFALAFVALAMPAQARPLWLVEFIYMAEGRTLAEHDEYAATALVFAARQGIEPLITLDRVPGFAHPGPIAPDRIVFWSLPDRAAFDAWTNDGDRLWFEDMTGHILAGPSGRYLAREHAVEPIGRDRFYLVDILRFLKDMDVQAFDNYASDLAQAGQRHGLRASAAFGDVEHLSGPWTEVDRMHLYHVPDMAALDRLLADPGYRKIEGQRRGLFDVRLSARQLYVSGSTFQP